MIVSTLSRTHYDSATYYRYPKSDEPGRGKTEWENQIERQRQIEKGREKERERERERERRGLRKLREFKGERDREGCSYRDRRKEKKQTRM